MNIQIKEKNGKITEYARDQNGVIHQLYPERFTYDEKYVHIYDEPDRVRKAEALQQLRLAWLMGVTADTSLTSLIDIGYGNGAFLRHCKDNTNLKLYGSDISGVDTPAGVRFIDPADWINEPASVVTFWDVLEHFPDLSFVRLIAARYIIVSMPWCHFNRTEVKYFDKTIADEDFSNWFHRKPNEHLHHFDRDSLIAMMKMYGWKCIATTNIEDLIRKRYDKNILTAAFARP
jgi:hypothetical protein